MRNKVLAEELFSPAAVVAVAASLGVISYYPVSDFEALDGGAEGGDFAYCFVAGDEGELGCVSGGLLGVYWWYLPGLRIRHRVCGDLCRRRRRPLL